MDCMFEKKLDRYVYVCPYCFNKLSECECPIYPMQLIQIDKNIYPTIKLLNKKGYRTQQCCEGHIGTDEQIVIMFKNCYNFKKPLHNDFKCECGGVIHTSITGKSNLAKARKKNKLLKELYQWATMLEPANKNQFR